jgi:hypothetical protein
MERFTTDECRAIAERRMRALQDLAAGDALPQYRVGHGDPGIQDELGTEAGKPYRCRMWASRVGDDSVLLSIAVDPMPETERRGLLGLVDAWRGGRPSRRSMQSRLLPL